jgi:ubiquitin-like protein Pup
MAEQERKPAKRDASKTDAPPPTTTKSAVAEKGEKLKKTIDEVIDEIDDVLEENADEFVKGYVQRGGE